MRSGWLLLVIATGLIACEASERKEPAASARVRNADSTPLAATPPATPVPAGTPYKVVSRRIEEKKESPKYEITMEYPAIEGAQMNTAHRNFNRMVADTITRAIAEFREMVAEVTPMEMGEGTHSTLQSDFEVAADAPGIISVAVRIYQYIEGAAHPGSSIWTFNYDLINDRPVALRNLFIPEASYLDTISTISIARLKNELGEMADPEMIREGAGAAESNFRNFTLAGDSLVLDFDEYQVAPYAAGHQRVAIAYRRLSTILSPDGPVAHLR